MSARRTAVLAVVFFALAVYFALFEGFSAKRQAPPQEAGEKIIACDPKGLREIEISAPRGKVAAERGGHGWTVKGSVAAPGRAADAFADLAQSLCGLPIVDRIESPGSLGDFGLEAPGIELRVVNGDRTEGLMLGSSTPASNLMYVKKTDRREVLKVGVLLRSDVEKVIRNASEASS